MNATAADVALPKGKAGDPFSSAWRRRLPLLPALLYVVAITQLPFIVSIYYSFTNLKDKTQSLIPEPTRYVGFANYKLIFSDAFFSSRPVIQRSGGTVFAKASTRMMGRA